MAFTLTSEISFLSKLKMFYVTVNKASTHKIGLKTRLIISFGKTMQWQCGLVSLGNGMSYISINKKRMKELNLREGDQVKFTLTEDHSKYGMDLPEELSAIFEFDDEANRRFHLITPGKQRNIINHINQLKTPARRIERAIFLMDNIKTLPEGKETVRELLLGKNNQQ